MSIERNNIEEMTVQTESMQQLHIVYMRRVGQYGMENQKLMEQFKTWVKGNGLFEGDAVILGIALDDIQKVLPENCRYDVCLVVSEGFTLPNKEVLQRTLPGGEYVIMKIPHTVKAVQRAWSEGILSLVARGYQLDYSRPIIERFARKMVENHWCEICVPILSHKAT